MNVLPKYNALNICNIYENAGGGLPLLEANSKSATPLDHSVIGSVGH